MMSQAQVSLVPEGSIAIVGVAGRFPGARGVRALWENLLAGRESVRSLSDAELAGEGIPEGVRRDPRFVPRAAPIDGVAEFDAGFFGISPRDASIMDPQHRHFLEVAWEAFEDAGLVPERMAGRCGVFATSGTNAYLWRHLMARPELVEEIGQFLLRHTANDRDFLATRVSYHYNLTGPSLNIQTACSSSLVAVHLACQSLLTGECDVALAGGVTLKLPQHAGYLYRDGEISSRDGHCRPFDAEASGTVFGSGVGVVALKRGDDALADGDRIYAVIRGSAINNDGNRKVGYLAPSVDGQAAAIGDALALSGVDADTIGYVEAFGTCTLNGDPIEITALSEAFRAHGATAHGQCLVGSIKGNIGHLDTASGVTALIKAALSVYHGVIPGIPTYRTPNPDIDFATSPFRVVGSTQPWPETSRPRRAIVNSTGVGGTNAALVLEQAPAREPTTPSAARPHLLVLSAKDEAALERATDRLGEHLETLPAAGLPDLAWTLQRHRAAFPCRRALVAAAPQDAANALAARDARRLLSATLTEQAADVVFLLDARAVGELLPLGDRYRSSHTFREWLDRGSSHLRQVHGVDLSPLFEAARAGDAPPPTALHPLLYLTQYADAKLWMELGVQPVALLGHQVGEYAAAALAGVFSFEDGLALAHARGLCATSGTADAAPVAGARSVAAFRDVLARVAFSAPLRSLLSPRTGARLASDEVMDRAYWMQQLDGGLDERPDVSSMVRLSARILLALGPGRSGADLGNERAVLDDAVWVVASMPRGLTDGDDAAARLEVAGRLWTLGVELDWERASGRGHRFADAPLYPFSRKAHWIPAPEPRAPINAPIVGAPEFTDVGDAATTTPEDPTDKAAAESATASSNAGAPLPRSVELDGGLVVLDDIERVLHSVAGVTRAFVALRGPTGDERLVAYIELDPMVTEMASATEMRRLIRRSLPGQVAPSVILAVPRLPIDAAGNVELDALPDPFGTMTPRRSGAYEEPIGDIEQRIASLWRQVLGVERIGRRDNFFELGGQSVHALRVVARLESESGIRLDPRALFFSTLAQLAEGAK